MDDSTKAALLGVLTYLTLRLVDYLLPKGRHWRWVERYSKDDDDPPHPEDEKG